MLLQGPPGPGMTGPVTDIVRHREPDENEPDRLVDSPEPNDSTDDEETLVVEDQGLIEIIPRVAQDIESRPHLRKLSLKGNRLRTLPRIGPLAHLYYLNLSHNGFSEVPKSIFELQNLEILDLSNNALSQLPREFAQLSNLMVLSLIANNFEILPPALADLPKLMIAEIDDNPIKVPAQLNLQPEEGEEEEWLAKLNTYIRLHRQELEQAIAASSSLQAARYQQRAPESRAKPPLEQERLRSASESGIALRSAKRMGFVMHRNAPSASYVASLHARGLSFDGKLPEQPQVTHSHPQPAHTAPVTPGPGSSLSTGIEPGESPQLQMLPIQESRPVQPLTLSVPGSQSSPSVSLPHPDGVNAQSRSATSLQPGDGRTVESAPRSPIGRSPHNSPWTSPRPNFPDTINTSERRLSTLAEEHDVEGSENNVTVTRERTRSGTRGSGSQVISPTDSLPVPDRAFSVQDIRKDISKDAGQTSDMTDPSTPLVETPVLHIFKDSYLDPAAATSTPHPGATHFTSSTALDGVFEQISFALREFDRVIAPLTPHLPVDIAPLLIEAQSHAERESWTTALNAYGTLLERMTSPQVFRTLSRNIEKRRLRHLVTTIMMLFPELEAAWRRMQELRLPLLSALLPDGTPAQQPWALDEQLHTQLDFATRQAQTVLTLLNGAIARSATEAATLSTSKEAEGPGSTNPMRANSQVAGSDRAEAPPAILAAVVRELSVVCIRCVSSTRSLRELLDERNTTKTRPLQLSERRKFWEEVNHFLKAVIATLSAVKAALPEVPLLADGRVGAEVASLTRVAKEIPPLLEQSSYRVLLDTSAPQSANPYTAHETTESSTAQQVPLPLPTPLTATLGAAAQALISPGERPGESYAHIS